MKKIYLTLIFLCIQISSLSSIEPLLSQGNTNSKLEIIDSLFEKLHIQNNMLQGAQNALPQVPETLRNIFGEDQEKFNQILTEERQNFLEFWVNKAVNRYKSVWEASLLNLFSEKELKELEEIYNSKVFQRFLEATEKIDQSQVKEIERERNSLAISYGSTLLKSLERAKTEGIDAAIIDEEIKRIQSIQDYLKQSLAMFNRGQGLFQSSYSSDEGNF